MNKFNEFDWVKTPSHWKNINVQSSSQKKNIYIRKSILATIVIVLCFSSLGLVYAYNETFRMWVHEMFQTDNIESLPNDIQNKQIRIENRFLYTYHEVDGGEMIDQVYTFEAGKYVEQKIKHIEGQYNHQDYSFDYVRSQENIFTFHEKGYVISSIYLLNQDMMYFQSQDMNLCSFDLKDQTIHKLTNDNQSVNYSISPQGTYILINKNDEYWTIYNTKTNQEKRFDELNPYAHSNEFAFLNDNELIITASKDNEITEVISLDTMKVKEVGVQCIYPQASTFTLSYHNDQTIITDEFSQKKKTFPINTRGYDYAIYENRYILFESFEKKKVIIYDFLENQIKEMDYQGTEKIIKCVFIDDQYMIISNTKEYFILSLNEIFH